MVDGLVSIITPMYNAQDFVEQAITSVLEQTYKNWEMIIIDDASTDECVEIVRKYAEVDSRIRLIQNLTNAGVAETRNVGIKNARGRYIAFLDCDDIWMDDKIEKQLSAMNRTGTSFCYGMCEVIDYSGKSVKGIRSVPKYIDYKKLLKGNAIPCLTVLVDRNVVDVIEMPDIEHEDYACWLTIFSKYDIVAYGVQSVLARYRIGQKTVSSNKLRAALWTWNIYSKYLKMPLYKCIYYYVWYAVRAISKRC